MTRIYFITIIILVLPSCAEQGHIGDDAGLILAGCGHVWSMPPLSVSAPEDYRSNVANELVWWNAQVGQSVFFLSEEDADVDVFYPSETPPGSWGWATLHYDGQSGEISHCDIDIAFEARDNFRAVLRHELGHCLGLEHDDVAGSIMTPMGHGPNDEVTEIDQEIVHYMLKNSF